MHYCLSDRLPSNSIEYGGKLALNKKISMSHNSCQRKNSNFSLMPQRILLSMQFQIMAVYFVLLAEM